MFRFFRQKSGLVIESRFTTFFLIGLILVSIISYISIANSTVRTVTELQKIKSTFESKAMKVSELESKRLGLDNGINSRLASKYGFVEIKNQSFIVQGGGKSSLTYKN